MGKVFKRTEIELAKYDSRNEKREMTLMTATINLTGYFMALGDDEATAKDKVTQLSTESAHLIYIYRLGNTQPLIDACNASVLAFMDQPAKDYIVGQLSAAI